MTIKLKEDVAYILLKKMGDRTSANQPLDLQATDFVGRNTNRTEIIAHLDYLNQKGYINVDFEGDAYANKGPNPLPERIAIKTVALTSSGQALLRKMSQNLPDELSSGPSVQVTTKDMDFLKKVMLRGNIANLYDARDITEVIFRTMRDLIPSETTQKVAKELHTKAVHTSKPSAQEEIDDLWQDSNPLIRFLSEIRPSLNFDDKTFLFRVEKEGGIPKSVGPQTVVSAVFNATKDELSPKRIDEISLAMPGKIRELWEKA